MTDIDRSLFQAEEQICSQSRPERHVQIQSKVMCKAQHKHHPLRLHHAVNRTSAMALIVTCMYFLIAMVDYASCNTIHPSDVAPNSFGTFNFRELEEVIYDIEILKVPVPEPVTDLDGTLNTFKDGGVHADDDADGETVIDLPSDPSDSESEEPNDKSMTVDDKRITHPEELDWTRDTQDNSRENQNMVLLSKYGQKYLCQLPKDVPVDVGSNSSDSGNETKATSFNASALLYPLTKRPCLTRNTGWWTYEYCHGDYIRQYHSEAAKTVKNLWIGYYQNETVWSQEEIKKAKERIKSLSGKLSNFQVYHGVHYVNGTTCDLTGQPRRATVKIVCSLSGEERLVSVEERETCDYILQVETPLLCRERLFRVTSLKKPQSLSCSPLVSQEEFQQYTEKQERLRMEEEQLLKEQQEKLAAKKKKAAANSGNKPARKKYLTIADLIDPDADIDEITEQVEEEIVARKISDGRGGVRLSVGPSKRKSKSMSGLFDSGTEDQEAIDEQEQEDELIEDDEELQKMADRFGKAVLEDLMKGLSSHMSNWAKEKESPLRNAWERAIKKTQRTVAKLTEMKQDGEKKLRPDEISKLEDSREPTEKKEKKVSFKQSSPQEKLHTQDSDGSRNQETNYQGQEQKSSPNDGGVVDGNNDMPNREETMKDREKLRGMIQQLQELNRESLKKRQEAQRQLDREDLYVDDDDEEEEEEEEEGEEDRQIQRDETRRLMKLNLRALKKEPPGDEKEIDTDDEEQEGVQEGEEEEEELDEETLEQLGEDITAEVQKQLEDLGLGTNADIKVKVFTMPYDNLHKLIDDEDDEDDDEDDGFDEEDGDRGDLDAYGNSKESTADSASSSSPLDKDLPARSSVHGDRRGDGSKSVRRKGKRDNSEVKVFHLTLDGLFGQSEREEEDSDGGSTGKSSGGKVLFSSLLEQLMSPMTEERKKVNELESNYEQLWEDIDQKETEKRKVK